MGVVRVLLVDDQAPFLRAMSAVVEEAVGFEVVGTACTGEDCIVAAAELLPDLVLMDVNLSGIDGLEATRRLRGGASPPVVLLVSTYDEDACALLVAEAGAAAFVLVVSSHDVEWLDASVCRRTEERRYRAGIDAS